MNKHLIQPSAASRALQAAQQGPTPASPAAQSLLVQAVELLRAGQAADAVLPLREAALLDPGNPVIQHDLGLACLEAGQLPQAVAALQLAVEKHPRYADAYFRLGIALEKQGKIAEAIVPYDRATELQPSLCEAWFRAGAAVFMLGHRAEAIGCFRRAAAVGGNTSFARLGKARALLTEDRNAEAEKVLRHIVALDASNAMAYDLLGNLLTEYGRFEEARACFERAISASPLLAGSYYELVRCRPVIPNDNLIEQMEAALGTPGLESAQQQRLHLALGKAADDLGAYAVAMQHLDAAQVLRRSSLPFDVAAFEGEIERLIDRCTPDLMEHASEIAHPGAKPIFILGMPRSGTTLVEQIVSNHPDVHAGGELQFWNHRGAAWIQSELHAGGKQFVAKAATDYLSLLRTLGPRGARVTDKMPFNFLWVGFIHLAFPDATIIHCLRARVATALSIHQTYFHPNLRFPTGGEELVHYFNGYQRLMDHWRRVLPPNRLVVVDYEVLTAEPEAEIRRIIASSGLGWDDACVHPERNPRAVRTPSRWQARQPIYRNSVARWRRYEPWLGPLRALVDDATK